MSENENPNDIVKQTLIENATGAEMPITTRYVVRIIPVPTRMKIPLYENGALISAERLAELGLTVRNYTRAEVEAAEYAGYYAMNPTLAARVRQYAAMLTAYNLDVTATSDQINAAIMASDQSDAEKTAAAAGLLTLIHDIELNWNEVSGDGLTAWSVLDKLIAHLPSGEAASTASTASTPSDPSDQSDPSDLSDNNAESEAE